MVPYSITSTSISLVVDFKPKVIPPSHPNFTQIRQLLLTDKATDEQLIPLLDVPAAVEAFKSENVKITNGKVYYKGFGLTGSLSEKILGFINKGQLTAAEPYKNFLERAQLNPDPRAVKDLYDWVAASGLPITTDGCILAWKAVQADYKSIKSGPRGKLDHSLGKTVSEPREETNPDPTVTCSRGLHFCSAPYLRLYQSGGTRILALKIDPANVVAFPKDYNNEKGRACEYTVVGEVTDRAKIDEFYPQGRHVYAGYDDVVVKPQARFNVGDTWADGFGQRHKIIRIEQANQGHEYPVRTDNGSAYTLDGRFYGPYQISSKDLVQRI